MSKKITKSTWGDVYDLLEIAQPGDMIEFDRVYYKHWGIFIGNAQVIHRWGENDDIENPVGLKENITTFSGAQFDKALVKKSKLADVFTHDRKARVNNYRDRKQTPLPVEIILERAEYALGEHGYNLIYKNCEHFATDCRYGQSTSAQVQTVVGSLAAGIVITAVAGAGAYLIHSSTKKKHKEK